MARQPPHQITGLPRSRICRMHVEPVGRVAALRAGLDVGLGVDADRPAHHQPGRRLAGVDVGRVVEEVAVERVDVLVVGPQRAQRLRDLAEPVGVRLGRGRPRLAPAVRRVLRVAEGLLVGVGVHQPAGPGRDVGDQGDADEGEEGGDAVEDDRAEQRPALAERAPGAGAPQPGQQAEDRERVDAPTTWCRTPGRRRRRRRAATVATSPRNRDAALRRRGGRAATGGRRPRSARRSSVKNARKMSSSASRDSTSWRPSTESSRPATRPSTVEPVTRRTKRHISRTIRAPMTADAIRQPDGSIPKTLIAGGDQPLADLGVDDHRRGVLPQAGHVAVEDRLVGVLDVGTDVAVVEQRPGVLGVVGLVEGELVGRAEVPPAQEEGQAREADRADPAGQRVLGPPARAVALRGSGGHAGTLTKAGGTSSA